MGMQQGERRKWQRLESDLRVQLQIANGRNQTVIGTHLSPEGIFLRMSDPPPEGTRVTVCIVSDNEGSWQIHVDGVVKNHFAPSDASEKSGVGVYLAEAGPSWNKIYQLLSRRV